MKCTESSRNTIWMKNKSNLQQINQSMMYNQKENRPDLSASFISRNTDNLANEHANKQQWVEIYDKFATTDKALYEWLTLIEKEKVVINDIAKANKTLDGRQRITEKELWNVKENLIHFMNKGGAKHSKKSSGMNNLGSGSVENMIESKILKNFQKFEEILGNLMNYENKFKEIDNMMLTIDTLVKEKNSRDTTESFSIEQEKSMNELIGRNAKQSKGDNNSDFEEDDKSSISSELKIFKENRPNIRTDYHRSPQLSKIVNVPHNGRSTACQPTIREPPHNLISDHKTPTASKRKGSMPNAPFYNKSTRNNKRGMAPPHANRHFSTERTHNMQTRGYSEMNKTNNSCFGKNSNQIGAFIVDSHPQSRQSNQNNYTGYVGINSVSEPNPQIFEAMQKRGLGKICKQI